MDFFDLEIGLMWEVVIFIGEFVDSFEGWLFNLGYGIEVMWFMMDIV